MNFIIKIIFNLLAYKINDFIKYYKYFTNIILKFNKILR